MARFRTPVKAVLFLSSYVPLYLIMALRLASTPPLLWKDIHIPAVGVAFDVSYVTAGLLVLCVVFTGLLYRAIQIHSGRQIEEKQVDQYQKRNELLSMYLLVYVFVFAGLNFTRPIDWLIFLIFFGILGVLQINSELLHVNPMLGIRGYEVYEVTSDDQVLLVITDRHIEESIIPTETDRTTNKIKLIPLGATTYLTPS